MGAIAGSDHLTGVLNGSRTLQTIPGILEILVFLHQPYERFWKLESLATYWVTGAVSGRYAQRGEPKSPCGPMILLKIRRASATLNLSYCRSGVV